MEVAWESGGLPAVVTYLRQLAGGAQVLHNTALLRVECLDSGPACLLLPEHKQAARRLRAPCMQLAHALCEPIMGPAMICMLHLSEACLLCRSCSRQLWPWLTRLRCCGILTAT